MISGEQQLSQFPGLTRGLVAVVLYYDGRRALVNALRTLLQARDGHVWTLGLTNELVTLVTQYTDQLIEGNLITTLLGLIYISFSSYLCLATNVFFWLSLHVIVILEQIKNIDVQSETDTLFANRALGNPRHKKQVCFCYLTSCFSRS